MFGDRTIRKNVMRKKENQIDFCLSMKYYNSNRTPHTSHASDVSHGETFFYIEKGKFDIERTKVF